MRSLCLATALTVTVLLLPQIQASEVLSAPATVNTLPCRNRCWSTVFTNHVLLSWKWQDSATSATLEIAGMDGTVSANFQSVTTEYLWTAFASGTPAAEDAYDLRLTFYNGGAAIGGLTSRLAVVTGAFGETAVNADAASTAWNKVAHNVVIPYDKGWTNASASAISAALDIEKAGGASATADLPDASGYYGWKVRNNGWGYGTFSLTLAFPGTDTQWAAELYRPLDGTAVSLQ